MKSQDMRINEEIDADKIRLVDQDGEMLGVVSVDEGLDRARDVGLDLVEIAPNSSPPVCKLLDYGKYKYEAQKKANEARKKQKTVQVKEIKMRPTIDTHDFDIKMRKVNEFLDHGDKVKISMRFRGREMMHKERGVELFDKIQTQLEEKAKVEQAPKFEGMQMMMVLGPHA